MNFVIAGLYGSKRRPIWPLWAIIALYNHVWDSFCSLCHSMETLRPFKELYGPLKPSMAVYGLKRALKISHRPLWPPMKSLYPSMSSLCLLFHPFVQCGSIGLLMALLGPICPLWPTFGPQWSLAFKEPTLPWPE